MISIFIYVIIAELALFLMILYLKKDFPWLITPRDLSIKIDQEVGRKFFVNSFHPTLGWMRKENSMFSDETVNGVVTYTISNDGSRKNHLFNPRNSLITSYGDSFCFGRLVNDDETWQYYLSKKLHTNVSNKGVGNYGLDQALLRFEMEAENHSCKYIIINVVPETIARIHSVWKHYFEYGNTLAFKPVFKVVNDELVLEECPIKNFDDLACSALNPIRIAEKDYFYKQKFLRDIVSFPFVFTIFKRPIRNIFLLCYRIIDKLLVKLNPMHRSLAFNLILYENKKWTEKLFKNDNSKRLLYFLIHRFVTGAAKNGQKAILLWTPQEVDLNEKTISLYRQFLIQLKNIPIDIIDMTDEFLENKGKVYVAGKLGPHPSSFGNKLIAEKLYYNLKDRL